MKKVVVTGAAGFIGSALVERLKQTADVIGIDRERGDVSRHLHSLRLEKLDGIKYFREDLCLIEISDLLRNEGTPDVIVHAAATPGVRESFVNPRGTISNNVTSTLAVLDYAKRKQIPTISISSSSVYGDVTTAVRETDPFQPSSPYATSKVLTENLVQSYSEQFGIPALSLRPFTVFGPLGREDMMPWRLVKSALAGTPVPYYGDDMSRDWSFIEDTVRKILRVVDRSSDLPEYQPLNLGSGFPVSLGTFRSQIENEADAKCNLDHVSPPDNEVRRTHSDATQFEALFGVVSVTPLPVAIRDLVNSFRIVENQR